MATEIIIKQGDITEEEVDAIVNAANHTLLGGGGLDGSIHFAAGSELLEECKTLGGCRKGEAKITKGYNLPAKHIIHTVGPVYGHEDGREEEILKSCYFNCLEVAKLHGLKSIALPAIATGCFRFPKDHAAAIAVETVSDYVLNHPDEFRLIIFTLFTELDYSIYRKLILKL